MRTSDDFDKLWAIFEKGRDHAKLNNEENGILFQKIRSIDQKYLKSLLKTHNIKINKTTLKSLCKTAFLSDLAEDKIDEFIKEKYPVINKKRAEQIENTKKVLPKIRKLNWNIRDDDVNKLIQRVVRDKTISDFDKFCETLDNDILPRLKDYIIWSFYNQTTNDIIENIVLTHPNVIPALRIGGIKDLDFFFFDRQSNTSIPLDLKISYINQSFFEYIYKENELKSENEIVKEFIKKKGIQIAGRKWMELLEEEIITKKPTGWEKILERILKNRSFVINLAKKNPERLVEWLYSNQGPRLFNNNNRFFVILVDEKKYRKPWMLKSSFDLIKNKVNEKLDQLSKDSFINVEFTYKKGSPYDDDYKGALATVVFVSPNEEININEQERKKENSIEETVTQKSIFEF